MHCDFLARVRKANIRLIRLALGVRVLAGLVSTTSAQTRIRVDVSLVNLAFVARDTQGNLVGNLTFFPRIIGVLLGIEGLMYVINSFANFLAPAIAARVFPFLAASAVGEMSLCLWLLARGVNVERWKEQAVVAGLATS